MSTISTVRVEKGKEDFRLINKCDLESFLKRGWKIAKPEKIADNAEVLKNSDETISAK